LRRTNTSTNGIAVVKNVEITQLLTQARTNRPEALAAVFEALYPQLREMAAAQLRKGEYTLNPTALVNELYLRTVTGEPLTAADRRQFFAAAARSMAWIVLDHVRRRGEEKRGGGQAPITLTDSLAIKDGPEPQVVELRDSLEALGEVNPQQREVVELHYFAGLEFAQIAELLECSQRTVYREWERARAFLHAQLQRA
jgi:RNA polymerase sigma factor (TIGR02999 family)